MASECEFKLTLVVPQVHISPCCGGHMFLLVIILVRHWYSDELSLEFGFFSNIKFSSASWLWTYKLWLLNSMYSSFLMKCFEVCVLRFITWAVFWNYSLHDNFYWSLLFVLGKDQQESLTHYSWCLLGTFDSSIEAEEESLFMFILTRYW